MLTKPMGCPGRDHHTHTERISSGREGLTRQQIKLDALSVPEYVQGRGLWRWHNNANPHELPWGWPLSSLGERLRTPNVKDEYKRGIHFPPPLAGGPTPNPAP